MADGRLLACWSFQALRRREGKITGQPWPRFPTGLSWQLQAPESNIHTSVISHLSRTGLWALPQVCLGML